MAVSVPRAIAFASFLILASPLTTAHAASLIIALKDPPATMDPHFTTAPAAGQVNRQIFETLLARDNQSLIKPLLAETWEIVNDTTWLFHLRRNVKWTDGTPFTADDVLFSFVRAVSVPNAPTTFQVYLNQIAKTEAVDEHTLRITTKEPLPTLPENLASVPIVSRKTGTGAGTDDYNTGKAQVGTGPYKFVSWSINDNTVLERNDNYWGGRPEWDRVTYRMIPNDATRVATLLSGDVDLIESVPPQEIGRLKTNNLITLWTSETSRITYIALDTTPEALASGKITGPNGEKLDKNPLADQRVRSAMRLAIDTEAIVKRIYQDQAIATGQYLSARAPAHNPALKPWKMDVDAAKKLLDQSGLAGRFKLDLAVSGPLFQNSVATAEALAQSWTRIGIPTSVTQMPYPAFIDARVKRMLPVTVSAYQNVAGSGETLSSVLLHTRQPERGWGGFNSWRYSNPKFDTMVEEAMRTLDDGKRAKMLQEATVIAVEDAVTVPLWLLSETTGTRKTIAYKPRMDRMILPGDVSPLK